MLSLFLCVCVCVYPCDTPLPPTSNLNITSKGQTAAAFTLVQPGSDGSICLRPSTHAHLIVDLAGYVPAGTSYTPVPPQRLLDSRRDGRAEHRTFTVALPSGAAGAALTVTATEPVARGYITVWPCGSARPLASTLNFTAGQTVANMALATAGPDGRGLPDRQ